EHSKAAAQSAAAAREVLAARLQRRELVRNCVAASHPNHISEISNLKFQISNLKSEILRLPWLQLGSHMAHHVIHGDGPHRALALVPHPHAAPTVSLAPL